MDEKGRQLLDKMTDTEKIDEILATMRQVADALESLGRNPMFKAFAPKGLGL